MKTLITLACILLAACTGIAIAPQDTAPLRVQELPKLSNPIAVKQFEEWKTKPTPRAFAVSDTGFWWFTWNTASVDSSLPADPIARAVFVCEQKSGIRCSLYAVDDAIVWKP